MPCRERTLAGPDGETPYGVGVSDPPPFDRVLEAFSTIDAADPKRIETVEGEAPFEAVYHRTLARWVERLAPDAGPALRIASRCQHLGRHRMPREDFPEGVAGYKRWRTLAALEQESTAKKLLRDAGFEEEVVDRVGDLLMKRGLKRDPEVGLFEDAICLTFLELELPAFAEKHPPEKVISVLQKTWGKMTPVGHAAALALSAQLPEGLRSLVERAVRAD